jgi:hypothetical protein
MAFQFHNRPLTDLDDRELDAAEVYTLDAILCATQHYNLMCAAYEAISQEQARRVEAI